MGQRVNSHFVGLNWLCRDARSSDWGCGFPVSSWTTRMGTTSTWTTPWSCWRSAARGGRATRLRRLRRLLRRRRPSAAPQRQGPASRLPQRTTAPTSSNKFRYSKRLQRVGKLLGNLQAGCLSLRWQYLPPTTKRNQAYSDRSWRSMILNGEIQVSYLVPFGFDTKGGTRRKNCSLWTFQLDRGE